MVTNCEHITKAWPGAIFWQSANSTAAGGYQPFFADNIVNIILLLVVIVLFAFFYSRIFDGVTYSYIALKRMKEMISIDLDPSIKTSRTIYLWFCLTLIFLICVNKKIITFSFWKTESTSLALLSWLIISVGIFLFRKITLRIMDWVNNSNVFIRVNGAFLFYLGALFSTVVPLFILMEFTDSIVLHTVNLIIAILSICFGILYVVRSGRLILTNGFSVFFYFVYLCTLELLPIALLLKFIFNN